MRMQQRRVRIGVLLLRGRETRSGLLICQGMDGILVDLEERIQRVSAETRRQGEIARDLQYLGNSCAQE